MPASRAAARNLPEAAPRPPEILRCHARYLVACGCPAVPAILIACHPPVFIAPADAGILTVLWITMAFAAARRARDDAGSEGIAGFAHAIGWSAASLPLIVALAYFYSAPVFLNSLLLCVAVASLVPLAFECIWRYALMHAFANETDRRVVGLWIAATVLGVVVTETVGSALVGLEHASPIPVANSADRTYWMYADGRHTLDPPAAETTRVLVIGDSMTAADRAGNFVALNASRNPVAGDDLVVEFINAGMSGYSLEQIRRYFTDHLARLRAQIVVIAFYLDDINRELRYRSGRYLYSPVWPEWMQDVYYRCTVCRSVLGLCDFDETEFQYYRTRTYRDALPDALAALGAIAATARAHGAEPRVLVVPMLTWDGALDDAAAHPASWFHRTVSGWAERNGVPFRDATQGFVGLHANAVALSATDRHLNDAGHAIVADALDALVREDIRARRETR